MKAKEDEKINNYSPLAREIRKIFLGQPSIYRKYLESKLQI